MSTFSALADNWAQVTVFFPMMIDQASSGTGPGDLAMHLRCKGDKLYVGSRNRLGIGGSGIFPGSFILIASGLVHFACDVLFDRSLILESVMRPLRLFFHNGQMSIFERLGAVCRWQFAVKEKTTPGGNKSVGR